MSSSIKEIEPDLSGAGLRIGIVVSRFNPDIGDGLISACINELQRLGVTASDITRTSVPGALEIPRVLQAMAQSGRFDALVAIGCVIRGEAYHFEIVSNESARGVLDVQLKTGMPIANAVLNTENDDQALVRMHVKGAEDAHAAIEKVNLLKAVR